MGGAIEHGVPQRADGRHRPGEADRPSPERGRPPGSWAEAGRDEQEAQYAGLTRTIEAEVIPRLLLAHRTGLACPSMPALEGHAPGQADVAEFTRLVMGHADGLASAFVAGLRARGVPPESLYLDLLAPTAHRLGLLWEDDLCDFADVTLGLCRLQQIMRELSAAFHAGAPTHRNGLSVLLAPVPGEQHTLGMLMVAEFMRRGGWDVVCDLNVTWHDVPALVRRRHFDVVGLATSCESRLELLARGIADLRDASRNPVVGVMVGGHVFSESPGLPEQVGADLSATDARQAVAQAERLVALRKSRTF